MSVLSGWVSAGSASPGGSLAGDGMKHWTRDTVLSHKLAHTLRHAAQAQNIPQDASGWCSISDLLQHPVYQKLGASPDQIYQVVANDKKSRYQLSEDRSKIRAVQGHSVKVDVDLKDLDAQSLPPQLIHGTSRQAWLQILESGGLSRMKRLHIHLAKGLPGDPTVKSGIRASSEVLIYVDGPKALAAGVQFHVATNGAVLSSGLNNSGVIPTQFILKAEDQQGNVIWSIDQWTPS